MTLRIGILTVSDRSARGERADASGPAIRQKILEQGWMISQVHTIPDDFNTLCEILALWADRGDLDVILTTGGTGFSPRDVTPEATLSVIERQTPGLTEAMRAASLQITAHAMLSRAVAGIRRQTLIVNLPGNPNAAVENLAVVIPILPHAVQLLQDDPASEPGHLFGTGTVVQSS